MALINCSKCGNQISDKAPSCPHCGEVFAPQSPQQNVNGSAVQPYQQPNVNGNVVQPNQPTTGNVQMQAAAKPNSKGKIVAVIIVILVALAAAFLAIIVPLTHNFMKSANEFKQSQGSIQLNQTPSSNQGNSSSEKTYTVKITVSCEKNDWFSKYDVDVIVDNEKIATLPHGTSDTYTLTLEKGSYEVQFKKNGENIKCEPLTLRVEGNTSVSYYIACYHKKIDATVS